MKKLLVIAVLLTASLFAEIVVIVNSGSGVSNMSAGEVKNVFLGKAKSFSNGLKAIPIDQQASDSAYAVFYKSVAGKSVAKMNKHWVKLTFTGKGEAPKKVGAGEVVGLVESNKNMVGYVEKSAVTDGVTVVYTVQ
ncbi:MAG: phosphate ABC transporter substrate-binding protein [Campylobacterota bacterium]|nr:phosphate ABC transporter substrate-binding protein [Campylobacterota bacterium]